MPLVVIEAELLVMLVLGEMEVVCIMLRFGVDDVVLSETIDDTLDT